MRAGEPSTRATGPVRRVVAVRPAAGPLPEELLRAMTEDVVEVVSGLAVVEPVLALRPSDPPGWADVVWPGTPVLTVAGGGLRVLAALAADGAVGDAGGTHAAVVAGDAPDLPGLLLGKLFRALGSAEVAVCPAEGGGLVALAARLPTPRWLDPPLADLDAADVLHHLAAAAPTRRAVSVGPGWRRVRVRADLARLDHGLEGWEETRAVLSGGR